MKGIKTFRIIIFVFFLILAVNIATVYASSDSHLTTSYMGKNNTSKTNFNSLVICKAAVDTKKYIEYHKKLPNKVLIGNSYVNPSEYLYLATRTTIKIKNRDKRLLTYYKIENPTSSSEDLKEGNFTQKGYMDFANRINNYIQENHQAPPYGLNERGKMGFKSLVYNYSQILNNYYHSGYLPSSIWVKPWYNITKFLKISLVVKGTGGNVRYNPYMKKYLPSSYLSQQIVHYAKFGTPLIILGNGSGPKVMILAGVHGNELPSQIAAMRLINNLSNVTFKGTVYIMPFAIPYDTQINSRYWQGKEPNRMAHQFGSPTYQIVQLAQNLKVSALIDYHSTQPGGFPGQDATLCTLSPQYESYTLASFICRTTSSKLLCYKQADQESPGAVEDVCNSKGITSVTCEVKTAHGTASNLTITKSYQQMIAFLRYKRII